MIWWCGLLLAVEPWLLDRELPVYRSAQEFRTAIQQPLTASWDNVPLRDLLRSLGDTQRVGLWLDRRLDPTTTVKLTLVDQSLTTGLSQIASELEARVIPVGNVLWIAPEPTATWARTTLAQRDAELHGPQSSVPEKRQFALVNRKTIHWPALTSPQEILDQIAQRFDLQIEADAPLRHDLWGPGAIPLATATEALTLILLQYDLDFRWDAQGRSVRLVPFARPPLIERRYRPRGRQTLAELQKQWATQFPELTLRVAQDELLVLGRVEDHEQLDELQRPRGSATSTTDPPPVVPLRRRQFTLRVENVPIRAVMKELEKSGVVFEFSDEEFREAGVDLNQRTSLDVKQTGAEEFLKQLFAVLPVRIAIDDVTVRLTLRP